MTPYLKQVASHWAAAQDLGSTMFIFPNRRSLVFFKHYLKEEAVLSDSPFLAPPMLTINDFFCRATGRSASDRISLLVRLYDCYRQINPKAESLDEFICWGDVLLADFDDVDKYLVDARGLFANIGDLKSIEDDYSWLDERQKEAIKRLAGYALDHKAPQGGGRDVKGEFVTMWSMLHRLYTGFRAALDANGEAYEGQIYRALADRLESESIVDILGKALPQVSRYVFVGLNALNECERKVLRKMHTAGIAQFSWDYAGPMITAKGNGSTHFMERNLADFPGSFVPSLERSGKPEVMVCGIPSATGQAKMLPELLAQVPQEQRGLDFAVVLGDETMLMSVLNSLPQCPDGVNVTMGYPLSSSELAALMTDVMELQLHLRNKDGQCYFYHKQVHDIFSSGLLKNALGEADRQKIIAVVAAAKYFVPQSDFDGAPLLGIIFRPCADTLLEYLLDVIAALAPHLDDLQREFAQRWFQLAQRLKDMHLDVLPRTMVRLMQQLVAGVSVPFEGEPLGGLQIMGPLETRALDFRNLVIMGANESVFPRSAIAPSFVPPEIRKAFGLPTYEYQEDVWAYYFYRMISRAERVWMLYDSRSEGLNTGEESRYVKQLQYLYGEHCTLRRISCQAEVRKNGEQEAIPKTGDDVDKIKNSRMSASALQKYISCKALFYYTFIEGLSPVDEVSESLDPGMLGDVLHGTMQALYCGEEAMKGDFPGDKRVSEREFGPLPVISSAYIKSWLGREDEIRAKVHRLIARQMRSVEVRGRDLVTADIIVRMVRKILEEDLALIRRRGEMRILGLELRREVTIAGHKFTGIIDRLDSFPDGTVRVVDYKSGGDSPDVLGPKLEVDKVFSEKDGHRHKAALQFFIYDKMVEKELGDEVLNAMYAMSDIFKNPVPEYGQIPERNAAFEEKIEAVFEEMEDPAVDFTLTSEKGNCKYCDFKILCGRN
ncbi:MAG: PD-(D/E)XK nuclease family protein [Candidatus Cryptobacteroides sp.]